MNIKLMMMAKLLLVPGSTRNFDEVCFALLSASEMRAAPLQPSAWAVLGGHHSWLHSLATFCCACTTVLMFF